MLTVYVAFASVLFSQIVEGGDPAPPLIVPPALQCLMNRRSFYSEASGTCEEVAKNASFLPEFDECPPGSVLEGHHCVGRVEEEPFYVCPPKYFPSLGEFTCMKAIAYNAISEYAPCPEGYVLEAPLLTPFGPSKRTYCAKVSDDNDSSSPARVLEEAIRSADVNRLAECDEGFTAIELSTTTVCWEGHGFPVDVQYTCRPGDSLSLNLGGDRCLSVETKEPLVECDKEFVMETTPEGELVCVARAVLAANPTCPKGYRKIGRDSMSPMCHEILTTAPETTCINLNDEIKVERVVVPTFAESDSVYSSGLCSFGYDDSKWTVSDVPVKSRREKMDARIVNRKSVRGRTHDDNEEEDDDHH